MPNYNNISLETGAYEEPGSLSIYSNIEPHNFSKYTVDKIHHLRRNNNPHQYGLNKSFWWFQESLSQFV